MQRSRLANRNKVTEILWGIVDNDYGGIYSKLADDLGVQRQSLYKILKDQDYMSKKMAARLVKLNPDLEIDKLTKQIS